MELLKYEDYTLEDSPHGYKSKIDGQVLIFDTASQWKQLIDYKRNGKSTKKSNRREH